MSALGVTADIARYWREVVRSRMTRSGQRKIVRMTVPLDFDRHLMLQFRGSVPECRPGVIREILV